MNRLTAYAATSVAVTASILIHAFAHRPNTYSALVYLSQSNACILILANFFLLTLGTIYFSLQRLCFGALRAVEIETLYERGWYQATELCLAATIFRDEVGWAFGGLFAGILAGKVWGWLGEGRVDWLQQRPPDNPRVFHTRLSAALLVSLLFDGLMLKYCVDTVLEQARPGMFVMFSFEFAVLGVQSVSTLIRYSIVLREQWVIREQQKQRLEVRRAEARAERDRAAEAAIAEGRQPEPTPTEDVEMDPTDEDVPGWEAKGTWLFVLDLATDFLKSMLYLSFFSILLVFHGFPVHIIRDLIMTVRSLITRISGFVAYRHATRAMNTLPDATAEDLAQDKTCIVCREDMEVWNATGPIQQEGQQPPSQGYSDERQRPKKLPCGHILHKGCLKAWLERQQTCPTCRRPVLPSQQAQNDAANAGNAPAGNQPDPHQPRADPNPRPPGQGPRLQGWRLNLGPLRLFVGRGPADILRDQLRQQGLNGNNDAQQGQPADTQNASAGSSQARAAQLRAAPQPLGVEAQRRASAIRQLRIESLQQEITRELTTLALQQQQLAVVRSLQNEYLRLSALQARNQLQGAGQSAASYIPGFPTSAVVAAPMIPAVPEPPQTFVGDEALGNGSTRLPDGMVLPEGWTVLPLTRLGEADRTLPGLAQNGLGNLVSELHPTVVPNGTSTITTAIGLPPLPAGIANPVLANMRVDSPAPGPSTQHRQPSSSGLAPTNAAQSIPNPTVSVTASGLQRPPASVQIGDLLSRLAQAQEDAARSPAPAVTAPVPIPTQSRPLNPPSQSPGWGFGEVPARPESARSESTGTESSSEHNGSIEPAAAQNEPSKEKGKGKAKTVTVEDDPDEDDSD